MPSYVYFWAYNFEHEFALGLLFCYSLVVFSATPLEYTLNAVCCRAKSSTGENPSPIMLQNLIEKMMVLKKSVESNQQPIVNADSHVAVQLRFVGAHPCTVVSFS